MSARVPRRSFATPFIVTFAACSGSQSAAHQPMPTNPQESLDFNPPPPADDSATPPTPQPDMSWKVTIHGKRCLSDPVFDCPEDASCNPPEPSDYPCPSGAGLKYPLTVMARGGHCILVTPTPHNVPCPK